MKGKLCTTLFFIHWLIVPIFSQEGFFETCFPVNVTALTSSEKTTIAFAQEHTIYFMEVQKMKLTDSIALDLPSNTVIASLEYLYNDQALLMRTKSEQHKFYQEFPQDSVYLIHLHNGEIAVRVPGNSYMAQSSNGNSGLEAYNLYQELEFEGGIINYLPHPGELLTVPDNRRTPASGVVRQLAVSPDNQYAAIVYYNSKTDVDSPQNYLEIRTLPDLQVVDTVEFRGRAKSIQFSECSQFVLLKNDNDPLDYKNEGTYNLSIFTSDQLSRVDQISSDVVFDGIIENNKAWYMSEGEIIRADFNTQQQLVNIWSNLTPFFYIHGFHVLNEDELLIFGEGGSSFSGGEHGLHKYSLSNYANYSTAINIAPVDTLFDPGKTIIQNNNVASLASEWQSGPGFVSPQNGVMAVYSGRHLQIISALENRKLHDFYFQNQIKAFINPEGTELIIFEVLEQKRFDEFAIRTLNLTTGVLSSKAFLDTPAGFLDPTGSDLFAFYLENGQWLLCDGSAKFWKLNSSNLELEELYDFSNPETDFTMVSSLVHLPQSSLYVAKTEVRAIFKDNRKSERVFIYNYAANTGYRLEELLTVDPVLYPLSSNEFIYTVNKKKYIYDVKAGSSRKLNLPNRTIETVLLDKNKCYILFEKDKSDSLFVHEYDSPNISPTPQFKLPASEAHFLFQNNIYFNAGNNDAYIYSPALKTIVPWANTHPTYTSADGFNVNDRGTIHFRKMIISQENLEMEVESYRHSNAALFHSSDSMIVINSHDLYNGDKPYIDFSINPLREGAEPVWTSKPFKLKALYSPDKVIISPDDKYAAVYYANEIYGDLDRFYLIDLISHEAKEIKVPYPIARLSFSANSQYLLMNEHISLTSQHNGREDRSYVYSLVEKKSRAPVPFYIEEIIGDNYFLYRPGRVYDIALGKMQSGELKEIKTYHSRSILSTSVFIKERDMIASGDEAGNLFIWFTDKSAPHKTLKLGPGSVEAIKYVDGKLYVLLENAQIAIVDGEKLEVLVNLSIFENEEGASNNLVWYTPDGYYKANKNDIRRLHFVKGLKTLPLSGVDLIRNRPDTIMSLLGYSDQSLVAGYKAAYHKRLARHNLKPNLDLDDLIRPQVEVVGRIIIPNVTNAETLTIAIRPLTKVQNLLVDVNGVPDQNIRRIPADTLIQVPVKLNNGENRISLLAQSEKGIESDPIMINIYNTNHSTPKVYFFGAGVSYYSDTSMNLKYADKDIRKLSSFLTQEFGDRAVIDTLLNKEANRTQILSWKQKLMQTAVDDIVILSFSGHGLIDKANQFYFGTHEVDFNDPQQGGVTYQEIQALLDGIPARRKLLLLDACHSGEIDKLSGPKVTITSESVQFRGSKKNGPNVSEQNVINTTFDLMKSTFYDLNRNSGAFVIAAAGGREYAYESSEWGNGVFTYSFINAMQALKKSDEREGHVKVSELQEQVYRSVRELTNGQQRPTARSENIVWDWTFE